jgi:hypothetical protein
MLHVPRCQWAEARPVRKNLGSFRPAQGPRPRPPRTSFPGTMLPIRSVVLCRPSAEAVCAVSETQTGLFIQHGSWKRILGVVIEHVWIPRLRFWDVICVIREAQPSEGPPEMRP